MVLAPISDQSISLHFGESVQLLDGQDPLVTVECSDGDRMGVWKQTVLQRHVQCAHTMMGWAQVSEGGSTWQLSCISPPLTAEAVSAICRPGGWVVV